MKLPKFSKRTKLGAGGIGLAAVAGTAAVHYFKKKHNKSPEAPAHHGKIDHKIKHPDNPHMDTNMHMGGKRSY